jgi:hypothetical protein
VQQLAIVIRVPMFVVQDRFLANCSHALVPAIHAVPIHVTHVVRAKPLAILAVHVIQLLAIRAQLLVIPVENVLVRFLTSRVLHSKSSSMVLVAKRLVRQPVIRALLSDRATSRLVARFRATR